MPPCVLEAALSPGPMWTLNPDPRAIQAALAAGDPTLAVHLGGGCHIGAGFAACFDAYVASAAHGFQGSDWPTGLLQSSALALAGFSVDTANERIDGPFGQSMAFPPGVDVPTVRARTGRLSALRVFLCKSILYGTFVWEHRVLDSQKWRFPGSWSTNAMNCVQSGSPCTRHSTGGSRGAGITRCAMEAGCCSSALSTP